MATGFRSALKTFFAQQKKRLLKSVFAFFALFLILPVGNSIVQASGAAAQHQEQQVQEKQMIERNGVLETISKAVYFLVWPLLALAGLAMDNNLVYGSFMYLDVPLWKIRNIVRNFANLTLGLLFIVCVLLFAINPERKTDGILKGISKPQDLIRKAVIAGVLIQASWFIMMVLVDVSTILTYTVGALPQSILPKVDQKVDYKAMGMSIAADMGQAGTGVTQAQNQTIKFYWTLPSSGDASKTVLIAPCETATYKTGDTYIIGRSYDTIGTGEMKEGYCVHWGSLVAYKERNGKGSTELFPTEGFGARLQGVKEALKAGTAFPSNNDTTSAKKETENMSSEAILKKATDDGNFINLDQVNSDQKKQNADGCPIGFVPNIKIAAEQGKDPEYQCLFKDHGLQISELLGKTKSRTGPFVSLYTSMLDFASFQNTSLGLSQKFIVLLINSAFALVLLFPLVALVAVLFWRIVQLWIAIALSPFLVLKKVFDKLFPWGDNIDGLNLDELVKLLIAPVFIGFSVSLAMMFMTILKTSLAPQFENLYITANAGEKLTEEQEKQNKAYQKKYEELSGLKLTENGDTQELELLGFIKLSIKTSLINFSRLLIQIFGLGISWFLLFAAIKSTKIGKNIGGTLQKRGEDALMTTPIIPLGGKGVGLRALSEAPNTLMNDVSQKMDTKRNLQISALVGEGEESENAKMQLETENFFNGQGTINFGEYTNPQEKMRYLEMIATQAGNDSDKRGKAEGANDLFFGALKSTANLQSEAGLSQLKEFLNSAGTKKLNRADHYYASFAGQPLQYQDSNKKTFLLQKNDQSGDYEFMEQAAGNP